MKQSEFLKWLTAQGVETKDGTRHIKLYYKGKQSHLPRHPSKELKTGLVEGFNTQPPEGGWAYLTNTKVRGALFQHTAA